MPYQTLPSSGFNKPFLPIGLLAAIAVAASLPLSPVQAAPTIAAVTPAVPSAVVESDRQFLERHESGAVQTSPPPAPAPAPAPVAEAPRPVRPPTPAKPRKVERPPAPVAARHEQRPAVDRPSAYVQRRSKPTSAPVVEPRQNIAELPSRDVIKRFVRDYLRASEDETPVSELSFYADRVQYFDSGTVSRSFVDQDQRRYYQRWPDRDFDLLDTPQIVSQKGDTFTVRYRLDFDLRNDRESAEGETEHLLTLRSSNGDLKIVGIRERNLSSR